MKTLSIVMVLLMLGAIVFRYYKPKPKKEAPTFKPQKLRITKPKLQTKETAYDTAYARYLRDTAFKVVLKKRDWTKRVQSAIAEQDRLILVYHAAILKRRQLLNRQASLLQNP